MLFTSYLKEIRFMEKLYWTINEWISVLCNFARNKVLNINDLSCTIRFSEP